MLGAQVGSHRITRSIGDDGMGTIYEAIDERGGPRTMIRVLSPEHSRHRQIIRRFLNEALAIERLRHPNIARLVAHGLLEDGSLYLLTEQLAGEPLCKRLARAPGGRLPLGEALLLCQQLAAALAAAHEGGVVHRDIRPANIFLCSDDAAHEGAQAKLLDFGLARLLRGPLDAPGGEDDDIEGVAVGTPTYMPPEQCRGALVIDGKADVYGLGVLLFRLLAGFTPFSGSSAMEVMNRHVHDLPPSLRHVVQHVPTGVVALVHRMLFKRPEKRPGAAEVARQLTALRAQLAEEDARHRGRGDHEPPQETGPADPPPPVVPRLSSPDPGWYVTLAAGLLLFGLTIGNLVRVVYQPPIPSAPLHMLWQQAVSLFAW